MRTRRDAADWSLSPPEAVTRQRELAGALSLRRSSRRPVSVVVGVDVAFPGELACACAVAVRLPELTPFAVSHAVSRCSFPYIPGLLSFREGPAILDALGALEVEPDALMLDGHGIAHPRGLGIASHIGLCVDVPTIGVAKSLLCGEYRMPRDERGASSPLMLQGRRVGVALRTRAGGKPVFVSPGNGVSINGAASLAMRCVGRYRIPEPTRLAHQAVSLLTAGFEPHMLLGRLLR